MSSPAVELGPLHAGNRNRPAAATRVTAAEDTNVTENNTQTLPEFSLPPTDTGKDAWLFLAACWAVEALVWGKSCTLPCLGSSFFWLHVSGYRQYSCRLTQRNSSSLGFGFSFGVFQDYYSSHLPFKGEGSIAVVGTTTLVKAILPLLIIYR